MKKTANSPAIKKFISLFYKIEINTSDSIGYDARVDIIGKKAMKAIEDSNNIDSRVEELYFSGNGGWERQVDHIEIDRAIKILEDLKAKGCNYTEIMHHGDHQNYVFNGMLIRESTLEEIAQYEAREVAKKNAVKEIEALEAQIEKLKKSYHKI